MIDSQATTDDLVQRAKAGDTAALGELFAHYRDRLRKMVRLRLDRRVAGRVVYTRRSPREGGGRASHRVRRGGGEIFRPPRIFPRNLAPNLSSRRAGVRYSP